MIGHMEDENENNNELVTLKSNTNKYIIPTVEQITEYCRERNNSVDPNTFFDFYEAKGWMIGKNKVKDWKACVRTWEKRNEKKQSATDKMLEEL